MNENRASLEVIAPSVEEAIEKGLQELGLTANEVEVEVLDAGSRGLFGLGSRQARVRLTIKAGKANASYQGYAVTEPVGHPAPAASPGAFETDFRKADEVDDVWEEDATAALDGAGTVSYTEEQEPVLDGFEAEDTFYDQVLGRDDLLGEPEEEASGDQVLDVARDTVKDLLDKMKVRATVTARHGEAEDVHSRVPVLVDVRGNDLSILIGPKAETLNALQYISTLIISKELGKSIALVVDVEGYRARRTQQIRQLARRMAEQAVKTGRRQVLEPMPANERRLIHIELRGHPDVKTESVGEEPRRKVTIVPKNEES